MSEDSSRQEIDQVLVIDTDSERGQSFLALLEFIKVEARLVSPRQLADIDSPELYGYLSIFSIADADVCDYFIARNKRDGCQYPLVLLTEESDIKNLDNAFEPPFIAGLLFHADYYTLSSILELTRNHNKLERRAKRRDCQPLIGDSSSIHRINQMVEQVSDTNATVLILGESGTGKEVIARNIHAQSARSNKPFVPINCGAIPAELLESELFGHEKGAFTGAISARQGRFELAEGGVIFLDEIGDMPLPMQVKLLRVLQERCYEKVGSNKSIKSDVRVIAATHRRLEDLIADGEFREDLFYRLNVFPIDVSPLRERQSDIPMLVDEMIDRVERENRGSVRLTKKAVAVLQQYSWPGNVRELANLVERLAILFPRGVVDARDLPEKYRGDDVNGTGDLELIEADLSLAEFDTSLLPNNGLDMKQYLTNIEISLIEQALSKTNNVVARAATMLNMRRTTLVEKMRKYEIERLE